MHPSLQQRLRDNRNAVLVAAVVVLLVLAVVLVVVLKNNGSGSPQAGPSNSASPSGSQSGSGSGSGSASGSPLPAMPSATVPSYGPAGTPTASEQALLAQRVGFGGGVTGGAGGQIVHVTSDADSGTGSLRTAVAGNDPRWIVFDKDMTIKLTKPLAVGSNKTIDGAGQKVEITGPGIQGLDLIGDSNVIVESLTLHDFGNVAKTAQNNLPDAIHLDHAHGIWIDHNDLSMAGDKLVAVSNGSTGITVSWNHFHDQLQTFQIGNQATAAADVAQTVTVNDNFFDHTGYRNPVIAYGRAHVYNNYYLGWKSYGVRAERTAQMVLQNNIFVAGSNPRAAIVTTHAGGCNDAGTRCDNRPGYVKSEGNLLLNGAKIKNHGPQTNFFDPAKVYRYTARPATMGLATQIAKLAGPQ